jgi:hypothetical protein
MSKIKELNKLFGKDTKAKKINQVWWPNLIRWSDEKQVEFSNENELIKRLTEINKEQPECIISLSWINLVTKKSGTETFPISKLLAK